MKVVGVIPARMGSTRFPGKPLARIHGKPMLEHVYRRAALCPLLDRLVIATPDEEIAAAAAGFDAITVMTSATHQRAVDRVAEAVATIGGDVIVVIQGDEPLLYPAMIETAVRPVADDASVFCSNLIERIETPEDWVNPNTIKVAMDCRGNALYFSRAPIPGAPQAVFTQVAAYKQVCIIPFRRENLLQFAALEPTPLERAESIDMLRLLEHGYTVRLVQTPYRTHAVDAPEDIRVVEQLMERDALCLTP